MRQYFFISVTAMAAFSAKHPAWHFTAHPTIYTWANGDTVKVYDSTLIDSVGLRGWDDLMVKYPINLNDSNNGHIFYLNDSEIVK